MAGEPGRWPTVPRPRADRAGEGDACGGRAALAPLYRLAALARLARHMQPPDQPRQDKVPRLDERGRDDGEGGGGEEEEEEGGAGAGGDVPAPRSPWRFLVLFLPLFFAGSLTANDTGTGGTARGIHGIAPQRDDAAPARDEVQRHHGVGEGPMPAQVAEHVEGVVPVVGEGEGVDDGVVADEEEHGREEGEGEGEAWEEVPRGARAAGGGDEVVGEEVEEVGVVEGEGEEGGVRAEVEELGEVELGVVVGFVAWAGWVSFCWAVG